MMVETEGISQVRAPEAHGPGEPGLKTDRVEIEHGPFFRGRFPAEPVEGRQGDPVSFCEFTEFYGHISRMMGSLPDHLGIVDELYHIQKSGEPRIAKGAPWGS